jgi:hypothetical protein
VGPKHKITPETTQQALTQYGHADLGKARRGLPAKQFADLLQVAADLKSQKETGKKAKRRKGAEPGRGAVGVRTQQRFVMANYDKDTKTKKQTKRRAEAMGDVRNATSFAAVLGAALYDNPLASLLKRIAVQPENLGNLDASSGLRSSRSTRWRL